MKKKDLNQIAKIEKAIKEKYGEEAIQNPRRHWDKEKEEKYLKDLKQFHSNKDTKEQIEEKEGLVIKTKKNSEHSKRTCPVCEVYSMSIKDDLYMTKYKCCFNCFIQYIEGREERWKSGWRPNH
tara:strand:+ start:102 stop:473 length:372 start_codon:yes stop_codon:yes gene_type:complete